MLSIALMRVLHKQFDDTTRELMRKKIDMIFHARHHVYTRTEKERRVIGCDKSKKREDWIKFIFFICHKHNVLRR